MSIKRGEIMYLTQCTPVLLKLRSLPSSAICTDYLPIYYGARAGFLTSRSKLITYESPEYPCSPSFQPHFLLGKYFFNSHKLSFY